MKLAFPLSMAVVALALAPAGAFGGAPRLEPGVRILDSGKPIDVRVGHLVPVVVDWDRDGRKDLLVGQFLEGKIRFYRNVGSDDAPVFDGFRFLRAGEKELSVPSG